jgi:hypothetical protein
MVLWWNISATICHSTPESASRLLHLESATLWGLKPINSLPQQHFIVILYPIMYINYTLKIKTYSE